MGDFRNEFTFTVRSLHALSGDRNYRAYFCDGEFFLIRIGGQNMDALAMQFGLVGALIAAWFRRGEKSARQISELDRSHPRELLLDHKHNFSFRPSDAIDVSIEPAPLLPQHGACVGRWMLTLKDGAKWKFQFEDLEQMHCAVQNLPNKLGNTVRVGVQWDAQKQKYRAA